MRPGPRLRSASSTWRSGALARCLADRAQLRLGEQAVVQRRIDLDRLDRHLVRALDAFDHGLHRVRELQAAYGLEIAVEDSHLAHAPVHATRLAVDLCLE